MIKEMFEKFIVNFGIEVAKLTIDELIKLEDDFKVFLNQVQEKFNEQKNKKG